MSELKKENFELKLRIYFLEEKLEHSQTDSEDDAFKMVSHAIKSSNYCIRASFWVIYIYIPVDSTVTIIYYQIH